MSNFEDGFIYKLLWQKMVLRKEIVLNVNILFIETIFFPDELSPIICISVHRQITFKICLQNSVTKVCFSIQRIVSNVNILYIETIFFPDKLSPIIWYFCTQTNYFQDFSLKFCDQSWFHVTNSFKCKYFKNGNIFFPDELSPFDISVHRQITLPVLQKAVLIFCFIYLRNI